MTLNLDGRLAKISTDSPSLFSARVECAAVRNNLSYPEGTPQFKSGMKDLKFLEMACTLPNKLKIAAFDFAFKQSVGSILTIGDAGAAAMPLLPNLREEYLRTNNPRVKRALIAAIASIDPATTAELLQNADTQTMCDSIGAACGFAKRRNRSSVITTLENCGNSAVRETVKWWQAEAEKRSNASAHVTMPFIVSAVRGNVSRLVYRAACSPLIRKHVVDRYHKLFLRYKIALVELQGVKMPAALKSL